MGSFLRRHENAFLGGRLIRWAGSIVLLAIGLMLVLGSSKSQADRIENTILGGIALVVGVLVLAYTVALDLQVWQLRRPQRMLAPYVKPLAREGRVLPVPRMAQPPRLGISHIQMHNVEHDAHALALAPWGEQAEVSVGEGYLVMNAAIPLVRGTAADWGYLVELVRTFMRLPQPCCYIGAAEVLFRLAYQSRGTYAPVALHLGLLYVALAQLADFSQPDALIIRVKLLAAGGSRQWLRLADETLALLKQTAPDHPRLPNAEALLYEQRAMLKQALDAYERALANPPSREEWVRDMASFSSVLHAAGRKEEALQVNEQALQVAPDDPWIWHNQSLLHFDLKRYEEARHCNKRALEIADFPAALEIQKQLKYIRHR